MTLSDNTLNVVLHVSETEWLEDKWGTSWPPTVHRSKLHDPADSGLAIHALKTPLVLDQHSLVSKATVPGRLAPVQIGGGW